MTSFSTYASRFLATGASAGPIQHHHPHHQPSTSLAFNSSLYRPFSGHESGHPDANGEEDGDVDADGDATALYENGSEDERSGRSKDGATARQSGARGKQRHLPHLQAQTQHGRAAASAPGASSSSSRIFRHFIPGGGASGTAATTHRPPAIADMEDEEADDDDRYDDEERHGRGLHQQSYPADRRVHANGSSVLDEGLSRTPSGSRMLSEVQDPFLAEDDLQRKNRMASTSPRKHMRGPSAEAKARGWMVHGAESSSSVASETDVGGNRKWSSRNRAALPDDIYRDPDEESLNEGEDNQARQRRDRERLGLQKGAYPAYNDDDDDDESRHTSTNTSDEEYSDNDTHRTGRRQARRGTITKAAGSIGSSLREPLLSSAGSEVLGGGQHQPPGAFRGTTSRLAASDLYAYPHPPAKTGWTPWAPGNRVPLRQYKDKAALAVWLAAATGTLLVAGWMSLGANSISAPSSPSTRPSPYYTLTRSMPILFFLTLLSIGAATANLIFLRNIKRVGGTHVLRYGLIGVPLVLAVGWAWAFAGSFIYDDEHWSGGSWSTTGLRIFSLFPLIAAIFFARGVWKRRDALSRSLSVLELSAHVVTTHPSLLILSLAILAGFLLITAPFLSIFVRLFLRGHFGKAGSGGSNTWHTDGSARLMAWLTLGVWVWTWLVLRGIQRVTVAGVVSHWYFHRDEKSNGNIFYNGDEDDAVDDSLPGPAPGEWLGEEQSGAALAPSHLAIVRASFVRATGPALGTICISALMLSVARVGMAIAASARWMHRKLSASSSRFPVLLQPLTYVVALLAGISALLQGLSDYALIYVGVTGDGFMPAARRSSRLVSRHSVKSIMEGLVINMLLDLTTLALCFLTGVAGFLFSAHNLHVPADAPLVGLLCALLPYWTLRLCADVLSNAADTLYLCFSIDEASGEQHCQEAVEAFTKSDERLPF